MQSIYTNIKKQLLHPLSYLVLVSLLLFANCGQTNTKIDEPSINENLDGYWVLINYVDDILKTKSIAPHTSKRLTWDAIVMKIYGDSLVSHGLIMGNKFHLSDNADSLTTIKGLGKYQLSYDKTLQQIKAIAIKDKSEKEDTIKYYFRRIKPTEQRLIAGIDEKPFFENLERNFYDYFIDSIISGTYQLISETGDFKTLTLGAANSTSGFKNFNKYSIHDYFGTYHPYNGNDIILFEDTTMPPPKNAPPTNIACYHWAFNSDTLTLTEMLTKTHQNYFLGTKRFKFLCVK